MRATVPIVAVLLITACGRSPMGSTEPAGPPADAPTAMAADYSGDFDVLGTEPFWSVKVRASVMTLARPDHPDATTARLDTRVEGEVGVFDAPMGEHRLVLRLIPGECSDGMSDRRYDYFAEVTVDGETLKGCASRPGNLAAQPKP
ncbi:hypothetical protein [Caulobacter sp.]|uniref:COG3650 family protein n=1 Tax=Caulobacter sp. TaxID=78 RepID=UPI002B4A0BE0|nr:hypothetical protein [Caulobacter sp.]HJV42865.1 hypothetical protein [Caulobacter sp.]